MAPGAETAMSEPRLSILLVGCGRMGGALVRGWAGAHDILVFDPHAAPITGARKIERIGGADIPPGTIVVLAVKPQMFDAVVPALAPLAARGALIVSIMAGLTLARLGSALGGTRRVVRAMPNTAAAIGRGITALVADSGVDAGDRGDVDRLLAATGALVWLDDEGDLDAVTAVSGSGPAYFFRMTEALAAAGVGAGLAPDLAMTLARATFTGAAALADARPEPLAELRAEVTSPGGTTAAGLAAMAEGGIDGLLDATVRAAAARSRALSA